MESSARVNAIFGCRRDTRESLEEELNLSEITRSSSATVSDEAESLIDVGSLKDRLRLEQHLRTGFVRLTLFFLLAVLTIAALQISSSNNGKRGVLEHLEAAFNIADDNLESVVSLGDARGLLQRLSKSSRDFMPLSSENIQSDSPSELLLVSERTRYGGAMPLVLPPGVKLRIDGASWSLAVWARAPAGATGLSILRQPLSSSMRGLSCWNWVYPSSIVFGASDGNLGAGESLSGEKIVAASDNGLSADGGVHHEVIVVRQRQSVSFYRDGALKEVVPLDRDITDCKSREIPTVGSTGLNLAHLTFYPRELSPADVQEIFSVGGPLQDVSRGAQPNHVYASDIELLRADLAMDLDKLQNKLERNQEKTILGSVMQQNSLEGWAFEEEHFDLQPTTPIKAVLRNDSMFGMPYYSVLEDPKYIDSMIPVDLETLPEWRGAAWRESMTVTYWTRLENQGRIWKWYLDEFQPVMHNWLDPRWTNMRYTNGPGVTSGAIGKTFAEPGMESNAHLVASQDWRLTVTVWDKATKSVRTYLDAELVYDSADPEWGLPEGLPLVDAVFPRGPDESAAIGQGGYKGGLMMLRLYHDVAWSHAMVRRFHDEATYRSPDGSVRKAKDCRRSQDMTDDLKWRDMFGNGCAWYHRMIREHPTSQVCYNRVVQGKCPLACTAFTECYNGHLRADLSVGSSEIFRSGDRVRYLEALKGEPTIVCPGRSVDVAAEIAECRRLSDLKDERMFPNGAVNSKQGWHFNINEMKNNFGNRVGTVNLEVDCPSVCHALRPSNLTDCEVLAKVLQPEQCAWDDSWMDELDDRMARQEEFMMSFWFKSPGTWRFPPSFSFFSSLAPPHVAFALGVQAKDVYAMRVYSKENEKYFYSWISDTFTSQAVYNPHGWNHLAFGWRWNSEKNGYGVHVALNGVQGFKLDVFGSGTTRYERPFFKAFSVEGDVIMSAVKIQPGRVSDSRILDEFYTDRVLFAARVDPAVTERVRSNDERIGRSIASPRGQVVLLSPPIVYQERSMPVDCLGSFPSSLLDVYVENAKSGGVCGKPYRCVDGGKVVQPADFRQSSGPQQVAGAHFGTRHRNFLQADVFAEILYSLDAPFIVRREPGTNEQISRASADWMDIHSKQVTVLMLFYTVGADITTLLRVHLEVFSARVTASKSIEHFAVVKGKRLEQAIVYFAAASAILLSHVLFDVYNLCRRHRNPSFRKCCVSTAEFFLLLIVLVGNVLKVSWLWRTERRTLDTLNAVTAIPWQDDSFTEDAKITSFLEAVASVTALIDRESLLSFIFFVIAVALTQRTVAATSLHPRIALITNTIVVAMDDLWHFGVMALMIFSNLAMLATWALGAEHKAFESVGSTVLVQFSMVYGEIPDGWDQDVKIVVYVIIMWAVFVILALNFLLSIIVDAYMKVKEYNQIITYEREFAHDVTTSFYRIIQRWRFDWSVILFDLASERIPPQPQATKIWYTPPLLLILKCPVSRNKKGSTPS